MTKESVGDLYAHRLAIMLECALLNPTATWNDAHSLLDEYRRSVIEEHGIFDDEPATASDMSAERVAKIEESPHEPVAWMYDWYEENEDLDGVPTGGIVNDWISKDYDESHSPTMGCHNIRPLYAAPPHREWRSLTDDRISELVKEASKGSALRRDGSTSLRIARAIEAELMEINT